MGWADPSVGSGQVGSGRDFQFSVGWVGLAEAIDMSFEMWAQGK